ncbi:hypothetical protein ACT9W4_003589 [Vibrio cholerae]|uniref:hypothetical protein n=1 Tax=Vibrio metoecus TaxID=1481663 RepID=UPI001140C5CF|nr:hypothetical protein [Vibrio metoecus]EKF9168890.1 hypothetical protein [Vibrio cholerae]EKF9993189.1 hypothetical protein [Vibrio cholerae]
MKDVREAIKIVSSDTIYNKNNIDAVFNLLVQHSRYDVNVWNINEIQEIESLMSNLAEKSFAAKLYQDFVRVDALEENEAIKLVRFLFEMKFYKDKVKSLENVRTLRLKYPDNQIFSYLIANIVYNLEEYELELLLESQKAICILIVQCTDYKASEIYSNIGFNLSVRLFYKYLAQHDYINARSLIEQLDNFKQFTENTIYNNILAGLPFTLEQSRSLYELNKTSLYEMKKKVNKLGQDSNKKSFEILIVFTAVITFLVTAAGATTSEYTSISGLASLGFTLLTFVIASLMCLERPKNLFSDPRLLILVLALISTLLMVLVDKYDKFEILGSKTIYIEFPHHKSEEVNAIQVPFRLE